MSGAEWKRHKHASLRRGASVKHRLPSRSRLALSTCQHIVECLGLCTSEQPRRWLSPTHLRGAGAETRRLALFATYTPTTPSLVHLGARSFILKTPARAAALTQRRRSMRETNSYEHGRAIRLSIMQAPMQTCGGRSTEGASAIAHLDAPRRPGSDGQVVASFRAHCESMSRDLYRPDISFSLDTAVMLACRAAGSSTRHTTPGWGVNLPGITAGRVNSSYNTSHF